MQLGLVSTAARRGAKKNSSKKFFKKKPTGKNGEQNLDALLEAASRERLLAEVLN